MDAGAEGPTAILLILREEILMVPLVVLVEDLLRVLQVDEELLADSIANATGSSATSLIPTEERLTIRYRFLAERRRSPWRLESIPKKTMPR